MSGMLTVVGNPRRRRRKRTRRAHASKKSTKRRRVRAANPARRRRRIGRRHRRVNARRRHRNPIMGGGMLGGVIKGATAGAGAVVARVAANAVNNLAFKGGLTGPAKIGLEAGVGVAGWMVLRAVKQGNLANWFAVGAGIVVAMDIYEQFVKANLPAMLQDYAYGDLNGWAPQAGITPGVADYQYGSLNGGGGVYEGGVYG